MPDPKPPAHAEALPPDAGGRAGTPPWGRNAIERMFCRFKDFRRVATRYDRLSNNYLAAVCLAATVSFGW